MKKLVLFVALFCLTSSAFAYTLNGRKWFASGDAKFYQGGDDPDSPIIEYSAAETIRNASGVVIRLSTNTMPQSATQTVSPARARGTSPGSWR